MRAGLGKCAERIAPEMKDSEIHRASRDEEESAPAHSNSGHLISNFASLDGAPAVPTAPATVRPAPISSVEHFQLKQALTRAKKAGLTMREVAQLVASTYSFTSGPSSPSSSSSSSPIARIGSEGQL